MEAKKVFDRFPDTDSDRSFAQFKVWVEHHVDEEVPEHKRIELRRGLDVIGTTDALRLQILREQDLAAFHALPPHGARKVGKPINFRHHDAVEREEIRALIIFNTLYPISVSTRRGAFPDST